MSLRIYNIIIPNYAINFLFLLADLPKLLKSCCQGKLLISYTRVPRVWKKYTHQYNIRGQQNIRTKAVFRITTNKMRIHTVLLYVTTKVSFPICFMCTSGEFLGTLKGSVKHKVVLKSNDLKLFFRYLNYNYTPFQPGIISPQSLRKTFLVVSTYAQIMLSTITIIINPL